jgi:hypothetical protein
MNQMSENQRQLYIMAHSNPFAFEQKIKQLEETLEFCYKLQTEMANAPKANAGES